MYSQTDNPNNGNRNFSNQQQQQPNQQQQPSSFNKPQPQVRHIPIYVEGRDEPLVNKNIETHKISTASADNLPNSKSSAGIFDRVKNFPTINRLQTSRSNSPHRTVPMNVDRSASSSHNFDNSPRQEPQQQQQQQSKQFSRPDNVRYQTPPPNDGEHVLRQGQPNQPPPNPDYESIVKIQNIQRDVLALMDQVERFPGNTRKDRQYMYLDEMLTQNLLKLDTIDTDGKENIKQARREAIKCINACIAVLEAKADLGAQQRAKNGDQQPAGFLQQQQQQQNKVELPLHESK